MWRAGTLRRDVTRSRSFAPPAPLQRRRDGCYLDLLMEVPTQITFRHMHSSSTVEADILERVRALQRFCNRIHSCRVVIDAPHHHHRKGNLFQVRVALRLPHGEVVSTREHHGAHAHEDLYLAIRDAFIAARRQLEDEVRRHRGDVKAHERARHGRVVRLFSWEGYGIGETDEAPGRAPGP